MLEDQQPICMVMSAKKKMNLGTCIDNKDV